MVKCYEKLHLSYVDSTSLQYLSRIAKGTKPAKLREMPAPFLSRCFRVQADKLHRFILKGLVFCKKSPPRICTIRV